MLAELVLSIALVSLVLLTVIELYPASFVAHGKARQRVFASNLAESLLDHCAALPLEALLPAPKVAIQWNSANPGPLAAELAPAPQMDGNAFEAVVAVERKEVDQQNHTLLVRANVIIVWRNQRLERQQWFAHYAR